MEQTLRLFIVQAFAAVVAAQQWGAASAHAQPATATPQPNTASQPDAQNRYLTYEPAAAAGKPLDIVRLRDGTLRLGRALEWGDELFLFDATGRREAVSRDQILAIEPGKAAAQPAAEEAAPDLTVAYVERLPRLASWHGRVSYSTAGKDGLPVFEGQPAGEPSSLTAGQEITLRIHVLNIGARPARPFKAGITIGGKQVGEVAADKELAAEAEVVLEFRWPWQPDPGDLRIDLDAVSINRDANRWNNTHVEPLDGQSVCVMVPRSVHTLFRRVPSMLGTPAFEDWIQHQVACLNRLFKRSVYPSAPQGCMERVRIDRIVISDSAASAPTGSNQPFANAAAHRNSDLKAPVDFGAVLQVDERFGDAAAGKLQSGVCWAMLKELCLQLGAVDESRLNLPLDRVLLREPAGPFVNRSFTMPAASLLHEPGPHLLSEFAVAQLNRARGRPRGLHGDGQYYVPNQCWIEVRGNDGRPRPLTKVEIHQRAATGELAGFVPGAPVVTGVADERGRVLLPNRPTELTPIPGVLTVSEHPYGRVDSAGDAGLLMIRLVRNSAEEYHVVPISVWVTAAARGAAGAHVHILNTRFAPDDAPEPNDYTRIYSKPEFGPDHVSFNWPHWGQGASAPLLGYRVYQRRGLDDDSSNPWQLVDVIAPNPPAPPPNPHISLRPIGAAQPGRPGTPLDTWLAVAKVGLNGSESDLSYPQYWPTSQSSGRMAFDRDGLAYVPVRGDPRVAVMLSDVNTRGGPQRTYGLRITRPEFRGYVPAADGIGFDAAGLMIVADAVSHQVAWYDRGELVRLIGARQGGAFVAGSKDGEFNQPADVAVDEKGRVYVADRGNHRLQVFDAAGKHLQSIGSKGTAASEFNEPLALGIANGYLCVSETGNRRVQIFAVGGDAPTFQWMIENVNGLDRALVSVTKQVYVCGRDKEDHPGVLVYQWGAALPERFFLNHVQGAMFEPRGLYLARSGYCFVACGSPLRIGPIGFE